MKKDKKYQQIPPNINLDFKDLYHKSYVTLNSLRHHAQAKNINYDFMANITKLYGLLELMASKRKADCQEAQSIIKGKSNILNISFFSFLLLFFRKKNRLMIIERIQDELMIKIKYGIKRGVKSELNYERHQRLVRNKRIRLQEELALSAVVTETNMPE